MWSFPRGSPYFWATFWPDKNVVRSLEPLHGCRYKALRHLQTWIQNLLSENPKRSDPSLFGFFVLDDPPTQAVPIISLPGGLSGVPSFWDFGSPCFRGFGVPPLKSPIENNRVRNTFSPQKDRAIFNQHWKRFSHLPEFRIFFWPWIFRVLEFVVFFWNQSFLTRPSINTYEKTNWTLGVTLFVDIWWIYSPPQNGKWRFSWGSPNLTM